MKLLTAEECRSEGRLYGALREQAALLPEFVEALESMVYWHDQLQPHDIARAKAILAKVQQ